MGASVLSYRPAKDEDGYYLMLVSPEIKEKKADVQRKQMIFVVDRSGQHERQEDRAGQGGVEVRLE